MTLIWRVLPILFLATTVFAQDGWWDKRDKRGNKGTRHGAAPDILKISGSIPAGFLVELGRIREEKYQAGLMFLSLIPKTEQKFGVGFLGIGKRKLIKRDGSMEWGYLFWPISRFFRKDQPLYKGWGSGQLYYRCNSRFASLEVGVFGYDFFIPEEWIRNCEVVHCEDKGFSDLVIYLGVSI